MILAIETSCDDSAIALLNFDGDVIVSQISSQIELHKKYGGIVPEIASRKHLITLPLLLRSLVENNELNLKDLKDYLKNMEKILGRVRTENKNGPRTIDLDIVVFNNKIIDNDFYKYDFVRNSVLELTPNIDRISIMEVSKQNGK